MRQTDYEWLRALASVSSIGFLILVSTGIGLFIGIWLDRLLGTSPWLTFIMTLFGLAAGLTESVKILMKAGK